ncbi:MAG: MmcQ/YjbR family DNA-binding protein [Gemmatimonadota bacterium]
MPPRPLDRLRRLCLALPEAHEVEAWGEPTFRVRKKLFAMFASASSHHGGGRHAVWCKATRENQGWMVQAAPDRYFVPPYVGPAGWVGVYLDAGTDWKELAGLLRDGYRAIAPKRLLAAFESPAASSPTISPAPRTTPTPKAAPRSRTGGRQPKK